MKSQKAIVKQVGVKTGTVSTKATPVTVEERQQLISRSAYLRAEQRGFAPGLELQDWLEAEAEIDGRLGQSIS